MVHLYQYVLGQAHDGGHDAARRGEVCLAHGVALLKAAHLYDGPLQLAVEATAQTLSHMSEVHVLIVDLAEVGVYAEVLVCRERSAKLYRMNVGHVAFQTLAARRTRHYSHLKGLSVGM